MQGANDVAHSVHVSLDEVSSCVWAFVGTGQQALPVPGDTKGFAVYGAFLQPLGIEV